MSRILYISHDPVKPVGGVRVIYRHVEILRKAGFDAYVVHRAPGLRLDWFQSSAPVLYATGQFAISTSDWIVIPEDHQEVLQAFANFPGNKVLFCQNHWYVFNGIEPDQSWSDLGIRDVLVSSKPIRDFVRRVMRVEPTLIPLSIDPSVFHGEQNARPLQVAVMPRKGGQHMRFIRGVIRQLEPTLGDVPWIEIQGCNEGQVAALLRQSRFFLSTGFREGFGLPPLEAMACGAIPVGFTGGGGADYATAENGFWVADEDTITLAETLAKLLVACRSSPHDTRWRRLQEAGFATARSYSPDSEASALTGFWSKRVAQRALEAVNTVAAR
jgi:glycosyltransferase involved in cell wall biosynthesis